MILYDFFQTHGWCKEYLATDAEDRPTSYGLACNFCIMGAIDMASKNDEKVFRQLRNKVQAVVPEGRIPKFNDSLPNKQALLDFLKANSL